MPDKTRLARSMTSLPNSGLSTINLFCIAISSGLPVKSPAARLPPKESAVSMSDIIRSGV